MQANPLLTQTKPAFYFPIKSGRYEVTPGLHRFGSDLQNGHQDQQLFQLDAQFTRYRAEKLRARAERLDKYYQSRGVDGPQFSVLCQFIIGRLCQEYPALFTLHHSRDERILQCAHTGEHLHLDHDYRLLRTQSDEMMNPPYRDTLDALACQIQEDLALMSVREGRECLTSLHLCFPNHWAAEEKIGGSFNSIHEPVAEFHNIGRHADSIVNMMLHKGPYVRFAWGVATDPRLNHHPHPPAQISKEAWKGRQFDRRQPQAWLRVERQVIWGLPAIDSALFTIRTYLYEMAAVAKNAERKQALLSAIRHMSEATLVYKGLKEYQQDLLAWLERI